MTSEYGTYRLSYTPPEPTGHEDYPNITIEMSTSGDADVEQMLRFYEAFLAAAGYVLKGDLQVVERGSQPKYNLWESPYNYVTAGGSQATDFISFENWGSMPPSGISGAIGIGGDVI
jgi:hypothetical protein